ncbi:MAG TPA: transglycosylase domain-containing protein [Bacteroidia bacterium]|nr:transglycosylase domain-containing protein [Bacteroidia bacterium]
MKERVKKIAKRCLWVLGGLCLLPIILLILVYFGAFGKLYSREELKNIQNYVASEVYTEDGKVLGKFYWENRSTTAYKNIPPFLIQALIATEDSRFYEHNGVDTKGLLRVFFKTLLLRDKKSGGGSTIGQQLSKNLFKRKNYGLLTMPVNKMKEAIHAVRFNSVYSQNEILALYLNTVSVGEDTYGIKNASMRFFNKSPESLKIEEGAILIGMLKSPTGYNPRLHPERALTRRNIVLGNMADQNYITKREADSLSKLPLVLNYKNTGMYGELAPYYLVQLEEMVTKILDKVKKPNGEKYNLYTDGLKITTPVNYQLQQHAVDGMKKNMASLQEIFNRYWKRSNPWGKKSNVISAAVKNSTRYKDLVEAKVKDEQIKKIFATPADMEVFDWKEDRKVSMSPLDSIKYYLRFLNTGVLAMEPNTGEIKAWVGGIDYHYFQYDHVTSKRQVGSTFKPIVYATAVEQGVDPCEYFENEQHVYEQYGGWSPGNSNGQYGGKYSLKGALANSVNVVSVEVLMRAGIGNIVRNAHKMGIKSDIPYVPSIALGVADISLLEMVNAYCCFANGGRSVEPVLISKIEDREGHVIYRAGAQKTKRVFSKQTAYYMTEMLEAVVNEGTASRLRGTYGLSGDIAGKTGTTQSQADGWFIGYTPHLVTGTWVGSESPSIHFNSTMLGQGAAVALPNWAYFMQEARKDKECNKYTYGKFYFGDNLTYMPSCESFVEDTMLDKLKNWFSNFSDNKATDEDKRREEDRLRKEEERQRKEEEKKEKREAAKTKREESKRKKKRFKLFGN